MSSDADTLRRRKAGPPPPPPPGSPPPTTPAPAAAPRRAATCCGRCRWLCVVLLLALAVVGLWLKLVCTVMESRHRAWPVCRPTALVNNALMRFFRDVARAKARRRLHRNDGALVTLMMGNEEPLSIGDNDPSDASTMTPEELGEMNGLHGTPLYLSVRGRIYDVTKGGSFYGVGKSYVRTAMCDTASYYTRYTPGIHPLYTFFAAYAPMYTRYTCIYNHIYT